MNDEDIRRGLPIELFIVVPEDIIRVVEARILDCLRDHPGISDYHAAMYVACQFAFGIATGGTK